jgi:hypothetical protein
MKSLDKCVSFPEDKSNIVAQQQKRGFKSFKVAFFKIRNKAEKVKDSVNSTRLDISNDSKTTYNLGRRHTIASVNDTPRLNQLSIHFVHTSLSFSEDMKFCQMPVLEELEFYPKCTAAIHDTKVEDGFLTTTLCSTEL